MPGQLWYSPFDIYYLILVIPAALLSMICQFMVKSTFNKYAKVKTRRSITGEQAARKVCSYGETGQTSIISVPGHLTDHFNPKSNTIGLSKSVYGETSVAAVGVAAHEAGHASQYAQGYGPIRLRAAIIPVTRFTSMAAMPLIMIGFLVENVPFLVNIGILCFSTAVFFQLITLPVEFNASRRALALLRSGNILDEEELRAARKVLTAAAMTYVAAMAVALMQLLRLVIMARGRRR
jgi:hypothetical protein